MDDFSEHFLGEKPDAPFFMLYGSFHNRFDSFLGV
jgi:hypothetical protein